MLAAPPRVPLPSAHGAFLPIEEIPCLLKPTRKLHKQIHEDKTDGRFPVFVLVLSGICVFMDSGMVRRLQDNLY